MQKNLIAAAVATLGLSSAAHALGPSSLPAQYTIYAGGGSSQAQAVIYLASQLLSNVDSYTDGTCNGKQSSNYRIFFGTLKSAQGTATAGSSVLLYYAMGQGDFPNGVSPTAKASTNSYPSNVAGASACSSQTFPLPSYTVAASPTVAAVPDWGLSNLEPKIENNTYNVTNAAPSNLLTAAQVGNLTTKPVWDAIFGIVETATAYTDACPKTNFSRTELQGILSGGIQDWSQLKGDNGCSITAGPIVLLDRAPGAGVKTASNLYFLGYPNNGNTPPNDIANGATTYNGTRVACNGDYEDVNESSNGNIVADVQTANSKGDACRAIGLLSAEYAPALNGGGYDFVAINGVDPGLNGSTSATYTTAISGDYDFVFTNDFNYRTKQVGSNAQHWSGDGTVYSSLITAALNIFNSTSLPGGSPTATTNSPAGVLLDPAGAGTFANCMTRVTRYGISQAPAQVYWDFSYTAPSCSDTL